MEKEVCSEVIASNKKLSQTMLAPPKRKEEYDGGFVLYRETMHRSDRLPAREFSTSSGKQPQFPSGKFPFFQYSSFFRRTLEGLNSIILESPSILATRRGFLAFDETAIIRHAAPVPRHVSRISRHFEQSRLFPLFAPREHFTAVQLRLRDVYRGESEISRASFSL